MHGPADRMAGKLFLGLKVLYQLTVGLKMPAKQKVSQTTRLLLIYTNSAPPPSRTTTTLPTQPQRK